MATKTISIELDVYERLKALKRAPSESFSQVLRRELVGHAGVTARELLELTKRPGGLLGTTEAQLIAIEEAMESERPWQDPWTR